MVRGLVARRVKVLLVLAVIASLLAVPAEPASACSCREPSLAALLNETTEIVIGTATEVTTWANDTHQTVVLEVRTIVLGESRPQLTATLALGDEVLCGGSPVTVGQTIAVTRREGGLWSRGFCGPRPGWLRSTVSVWTPPPGGVAHGLVIGAWDSQIAYLDADGQPIGYASPLDGFRGLSVCGDGRAVATIFDGALLISQIDGEVSEQVFDVGEVSERAAWLVECGGARGSATRVAVYRADDITTSMYRLVDGQVVQGTPAPGRGLIPLGFHRDQAVVADQRGDFQVLATLDLDGSIHDLASNSLGAWRWHTEPGGRLALAVATAHPAVRDPDTPILSHVALIDLSGTAPTVRWERAFDTSYDATVQWAPDAGVVALAPQLGEERTDDWLHLDTAKGTEVQDLPTIGVGIGDVVIRSQPRHLDITAVDGTETRATYPLTSRPLVLPLDSPIDIPPNLLHHPAPRLEQVIQPAASPSGTQPPTTPQPHTAPPTQSATSTDGRASPESDGVVWIWLIGVLGLLTLAGGAAWLIRRRARDQR